MPATSHLAEAIGPSWSSRRLQRRCACTSCPDCRKRQLQRRSAAPAAGLAPAIVHEVLGRAGEPLDEATRRFMEAGFQADFSRVRVHTDARADESARAVQAEAYTVGEHVVFSRGAYRPETSGGRELLAHELAHVLQQQGAAPAGSLAIDADGGAEHEAQSLAKVVAAGGRVQVAGSAPAAVQKADPPHPDARWVNTWVGNAQQKDVQISITYAGTNPTYPKNWYEGRVTSSKGQGSFSGAVTGNRLAGNYSIFLANNKGRRSGPATLTMNGRDLDPVFQYDPLGHIMRMTLGGALPGPVPPAPVAPPEPKKVCGPDITASLENTLNKVKSDFAAWPINTAIRRCNEIVGKGRNAITSSWEIDGLVKSANWAIPYIQAGCCQPMNAPRHPDACDWSVQVAGVCQNYYTPNYAVFGTMCRLCQDRLASTPEASNLHTLMGMTALITGYQWAIKWPGGVYISFVDAHQKEWARLAHINKGWVRGNGTPEADYPNCKTECRKAWPTTPMAYRWEPLDLPAEVDPYHASTGFGIGLNQGQTLRFRKLPGQTTSGATHEGTIETPAGASMRAVLIGTVKSGVFEGRIEVTRQGRKVQGTVRFEVVRNTFVGTITPPQYANLFRLASNATGDKLSFSVQGGAALR